MAMLGGSLQPDILGGSFRQIVNPRPTAPEAAALPFELSGPVDR